ncbi:MAG: YckD family protein [Anaerolineae bacterium]|nr:YckD family protein [Anaerolineae bacterium]
MFNKTKLVSAGLLVLALLVIGVGGSIALAQSPTPTTGKTWMDLYWQTLAQKLGTTVEKLQQAMTDARKEAATQGVQQGLLTQDQADRILGRTVPGVIAQAGLDAAAKTLGMSTTDLTNALRTKTLLTLAQEKNVDVTKLRIAIADAQKAAIDQLVKDGKLTQAQADQMKANLKPENVDLNRFGFGRGGFGMMGPHPFDGRGMPFDGKGMPFDRMPMGPGGRR